MTILKILKRQNVAEDNNNDNNNNNNNNNNNLGSEFEETFHVIHSTFLTFRNY